MKIALVDDDPRALAQLEQYLTEQLGRETEISHYGSGEALLADWRPGAFELVVLDIYMGGATGMEVARRLRADDGQVRLAFATSSNDFASESYEVGACYYLRKPFRPEGVRAMLERLDLEALERSRRLRLPDGSQVVLRSIRYAASDGHRVTLHCKDGDRTLRTSFAAVEPLLCAYPCFCGICRGVVVNFHEVAGRQEDVFLLKDGTRLPISRRRLREDEVRAAADAEKMDFGTAFGLLWDALTGCERTVSTDAAAVSDAGGLRLFADELPALSGHGPLSLPAETAVFSGGGGGAGGSADAAANGTGPVRCLLHAGAGQPSQRRQHGAVRRVLLSGGAGLSRQDAVYPADDL